MEKTVVQIIELMEVLDTKLETINKEYSDIQSISVKNKVDIEAIGKELHALHIQIRELSENIRVSEDKFECKHRCDTINSDTVKVLTEMREKIFKLEKKNKEMETSISIYIANKQKKNNEIPLKKKKPCCIQ
jgi:chromosome segregation ATPase